MKIGDMVKNNFTDEIERYGVLLDNGDTQYIIIDSRQTIKYFKVRYLPHPDIPFNGGDMYTEFTQENFLTVVSSIS